MLKAQCLVKAINALKMDQAIIFCRTKLDCDNIEAYLVALGGGQRSKFKIKLCIVCVYAGSKAMVNEYSCVCLHGDRRPQERKDNLVAFKVTSSPPPPLSTHTPSLSLFLFPLSHTQTYTQEGEVRFLICTDVAARGIDIRGVPFVVNVTLPDDKQNYVHRIGRVGRAERMGLAVSLVATVKEKVQLDFLYT